MSLPDKVPVVVTGLGMVTPLGTDAASTWHCLLAGMDARRPVELLDVSGCRCKQGAAALVPDLPDVPARRWRRWPRATRLAAPAFREALAAAGLLDADGRSRLPRLTLSVSSTGGAMALGEHYLRGLVAHRRGPGRVYDLAHYQAHHQVLDLQDQFGFRGSLTIIANACASGANAIGHGADLIRAGLADLVIAGGYEPLTELIYVGFDCLQALSPDRCRPFDTGRTGLMLGEAATFLVLESDRHARQRGANALAVIAGYGHTTDGHHLTQPHPDGRALLSAMRQALAQAGLGPAEIGYLNAHGTATPLNDASECAAFVTLFGAGSGVRISSTKAAVGHTLGAAGAVEAGFAIQALRTGALPPNLNTLHPEPAVAANLVAVGERAAELHAAMSVNLGFGGSNAALVFTYPAATPAGDDDAALPRPATAGLRPDGQGVSRASRPPPLGLCGAGLVLPDREPRRMAGLGSGEWLVRRVDQQAPALARWEAEPRVRRASGLTVFMLAAARQALEAAGGDAVVNRATLGIVAAFHTGVLVATARFFQGVLKTGQRFASPNLFPETVFNSPTSHLAAVLGVTGPCYSVVGDESAWVNALGVAAAWLASGTVEHALVIGAEELDPVALDAYRAVRWLRRDGAFVPAEGAGAVVLRRERRDDNVRVVGLAEGFTHRTRAQARAAAAELFAQFPGVRDVCRTAAGTRWARLEAEYHTRHRFVAPASEPPPGGAFVASAAWQTAWAAEQVRATGRELLVPVWGQSEQCAAVLLASHSAN